MSVFRHGIQWCHLHQLLALKVGASWQWAQAACKVTLPCAEEGTHHKCLQKCNCTDLCLVFRMPLHWAQLVEAMRELALGPIATLPSGRPCAA